MDGSMGMLINLGFECIICEQLFLDRSLGHDFLL